MLLPCTIHPAPASQAALRRPSVCPPQEHPDLFRWINNAIFDTVYEATSPHIDLFAEGDIHRNQTEAQASEPVGRRCCRQRRRGLGVGWGWGWGTGAVVGWAGGFGREGQATRRAAALGKRCRWCQSKPPTHAKRAACSPWAGSSGAAGSVPARGASAHHCRRPHLVSVAAPLTVVRQDMPWGWCFEQFSLQVADRGCFNFLECVGQRGRALGVRGMGARCRCQRCSTCAAGIKRALSLPLPTTSLANRHPLIRRAGWPTGARSGRSCCTSPFPKTCERCRADRGIFGRDGSPGRQRGIGRRARLHWPAGLRLRTQQLVRAPPRANPFRGAADRLPRSRFGSPPPSAVALRQLLKEPLVAAPLPAGAPSSKSWSSPPGRCWPSQGATLRALVPSTGLQEHSAAPRAAVPLFYSTPFCPACLLCSLIIVLAYNAFPEYNDVDSWEGSIKSLSRACCFGGALSETAAVGGRCGGPWGGRVPAGTEERCWRRECVAGIPGCAPPAWLSVVGCRSTPAATPPNAGPLLRVPPTPTPPHPPTLPPTHLLAVTSLCPARLPSRSTCCSEASTWTPPVCTDRGSRGAAACLTSARWARCPRRRGHRLAAARTAFCRAAAALPRCLPRRLPAPVAFAQCAPGVHPFSDHLLNESINLLISSSAVVRFSL